MMRVTAETRRHNFQKTKFNGKWRFAGREWNAVRDAEEMGIDSNRMFAKGHIENDIRRLSTDTGQFFKRISVARHVATMLCDQLL